MRQEKIVINSSLKTRHNTSQDMAQTESDLCMFRRAEVNRLLVEHKELWCELNECRMSHGFFGADDEKVNYYTGLPNLETILVLFHFLLPLMPCQIKILTQFPMLLLDFMHL